MSSKRQKSVQASQAKLETQQHSLPQQDMQDDRYPGSFFRVPGVPTPGKTTWSLAK
jgi:hypothetical protein